MEAGALDAVSNVFQKSADNLKAVVKQKTGKGLNAGYTTENPNGLAHIYPISHEAILQMLSCCPK